MSVYWVDGCPRGVDVGYDDDTVQGHVSIDQWQHPAAFAAALDVQIKTMRDRMVAEHVRLFKINEGG